MERFRIWYASRAEKIRRQGIFVPGGNSGYVLIIVLVVVALMVGVSGDLIISQENHIHYLRRYDQVLRAEILCRSGLDIAKMLIEADGRGVMPPGNSAKRPVAGTDSYRDIWAMEIHGFPLDTGTITIRIEDENSKINVSAMANEFVNPTPYYSMVQRLLVNLELPMDLADVILDWVDPDNASSSYGAESSYYTALPLPYEAKNGPLDSIHELLMLKGISAPLFYDNRPADKDENTQRETTDNEERLNLEETIGELAGGGKKSIRDAWRKPRIAPETKRDLERYLRAYGDDTNFLHENNRININTASFRVLSALTEDMTADKVTQVIERRKSSVFTSVDQVADLITDENVRKNILSVRSAVFRITVIADSKGVSRTLEAVYDRNRKRYVYYVIH